MNVIGVELTLLHALYILCLLTIITFFILRKDTTIICIVFIFLLALTATSSIPLAISGIFQSFIYAITELLPTILIISIIVSMSNLLVHTGINDTMISPFTKMIRTPTLAYWIIGDYLPKGSHGIINDLGIALSQTVPLNQYVSAGTLTIVGVITGLDGSGFSGISLAGSIANLFGTALGHGTATLTALGQIAALWTGGGALIPWALIPAAAICKVDPFELARRNFLPVVIGLIVTTIVAMFIL